MAVISPKKLFSDITAGRFAPAYYFLGDEDYRVSEAEKYVVRQFLPEMQLITNYRKLDGRRTPLPDLLAELSTYPMLGERQAIVISDFQSLKPKSLEQILKLLTPADPNRIVDFSSAAQRKPKKTSAFYKKMLAATDVVEFLRITPVEAAKILRHKLADSGLAITPEAVALFTEMIAGNRGALESEADKLIHFKAGQTQVELEDVKEVCSGFESYNMFELADYVSARDRKQVLKMIDRLMQSSDISGGLLWHLGQHFTSLYLIKEGKQLPPQQRWLARKLRPQANRFSSGQLEETIIDIAETTAELRRSNISTQLALEALLLRLTETSPDR
ncbi:MAG: DNA polymerase III subunit delta [candidate division Zixibacteria bacterium]